MQKSYRATRHQWQFPQFAAAAFKFNSTSIQTHVVAATIQRITEYRIWRNTEYRRILAKTWTCYEAKHSNHQIQLDIDLMPRCCSSHQDTLQYLKSLWKPKCSTAKLKNPPTTNKGRGATLKFTSLPSAPPDATEMLWEVLNRSNLKQGIQNKRARSERTTVYEQNTSLNFILVRLTSLFKTTCWGN